MNCEVQIAETKGPLGSVSGEELTVGRPFALKCSSDGQGQWIDLKPEQLELRLEEEDQYKLKLLRFEKISDGEAQLLVTSYRPGEHKLKAVQIVDAEHSVVLGDLSFTVKSVINPQEPPKEPYPAMGPLVLSIPLWFWLTLGFSILALALFIWWRGARMARRRKWIRDMNLHERVLSPMADLGKSLRHAQKDLSRSHELAKELDTAYRIYLARIFQIPTLKFSDRQILQDIRRFSESLYDQEVDLIRKTLAELGRASQSSAAVQTRDLEQLIQLVRRSAEEIEKILAAKKGGAK